jgi:hypothetical protein
MFTNLNGIYERLLTDWYTMDPELKKEGLGWYRKQHNWCLSVAKDAGLDPDIIFAITSALSPAAKWPRNQKDVISLIEQGAAATVTTYGENKQKALRILAGSPIEKELNKPTSMKTWNFYWDLKDPGNKMFVAVDRHYAIPFGFKPTQKGIKITVPQYREMVLITKEVAKMVGVLPLNFQSGIWHLVLLEKGLLY